jgi:hypothetical protein
MHDNKLRLSSDVIEKAEQIANEWGLKNARAAVEAVFRKYADDYLYGRQPMFAQPVFATPAMESIELAEMPMNSSVAGPGNAADNNCQASNELDSLLGL